MKRILGLVLVLLLAATLSGADDSFEFHGYGRAGVLFNHAGGQVVDGDKNVNYVGRLGNEPDIYYEAYLVKNWAMTDSVWSKWTLMLAPPDPNRSRLNDGSNDEIGLRQIFGEIGGVGNARDLVYWIGRRFYSRQQIHITDFYYLDYSGTGAGIQKLAGGRLDLAYITGNRDDGTGYNDTYLVTNFGKEMSHNLLVNYRPGNWELILAGNYVPSNDKDSNTDPTRSTMGYALYGAQFSAVYNFPGFYSNAEGMANIVLQAGYALGSWNGLGKSQWFFDRYENDWSVRFLTNGVWETPGNSLAPSFWIQYNKSDKANDEVVTSLVARDAIKAGSNFLWQFELGGAYIHDLQNDANSGAEYKATFAPTITFDSDFFDRPQFRTFVSLVGWTDGRKKTDLSKYVNGDYELRFGFQVETWF